VNVKEVPDYNSFAQFQVTLDGLRMHYVDVGEGPSVVLVHGSPLSSFAFRHQIAALAPRFRVIAPDVLGFGQSDAPDRGTDFLRQARLLRRLLDHLDLGPIHLLGHDWGGPIGVGAAADRPEQVRQLVLVNTTLRADFRPPVYWKLFTASWLGELLLVGLNVFGWGLPLMLRAARSGAVRQHYARPLKTEGTRRTILALERLEGFTTLAKRVEAALPNMRVPTLILWGHPDPYFGRGELARLREVLPEAAVCEIPGGGHFPMEDAPRAVTNALLEFFH
jgi:haloalkane dehalogenase